MSDATVVCGLVCVDGEACTRRVGHPGRHAHRVSGIVPIQLTGLGVDFESCRTRLGVLRGESQSMNATYRELLVRGSRELLRRR